MKMKNLLILASLILALGLAACGGKSEEEKAEAERQEAIKQVEKTLKDLKDGKPADLVNFRDLQKVLPEKLAGFKRVSESGETAGAMGLSMSRAEAEYEDGDRMIKVDVVDVGGLGAGLMGMAAWTSVTIDKEDSRGYERTSTFEGYKCYEKYRKSGPDSEIALFVANRFLVTANARNTEMDKLKKFVKAMDLDKLKKMK